MKLFLILLLFLGFGSVFAKSERISNTYYSAACKLDVSLHEYFDSRTDSNRRALRFEHTQSLEEGKSSCDKFRVYFANQNQQSVNTKGEITRVLNFSNKSMEILNRSNNSSVVFIEAINEKTGIVEDSFYVLDRSIMGDSL